MNNLQNKTIRDLQESRSHYKRAWLKQVNTNNDIRAELTALKITEQNLRETLHQQADDLLIQGRAVAHERAANRAMHIKLRGLEAVIQAYGDKYDNKPVDQLIQGMRAEDLKIDLIGNGGFWMNPARNRVRITHIPSSLFVEEGNDRSHHRNKMVATEKLGELVKQAYLNDQKNQSKNQAYMQAIQNNSAVVEVKKPLPECFVCKGNKSVNESFEHGKDPRIKGKLYECVACLYSELKARGNYCRDADLSYNTLNESHAHINKSYTDLNKTYNELIDTFRIYKEDTDLEIFNLRQSKINFKSNLAANTKSVALAAQKIMNDFDSLSRSDVRILIAGCVGEHWSEAAHKAKLWDTMLTKVSAGTYRYLDGKAENKYRIRVNAPLNVMQGSVAEHFTKSIEKLSEDKQNNINQDNINQNNESTKDDF